MQPAAGCGGSERTRTRQRVHAHSPRIHLNSWPRSLLWGACAPPTAGAADRPAVAPAEAGAVGGRGAPRGREGLCSPRPATPSTSEAALTVAARAAVPPA
eukprot:3799016-Pyramimonas_sp.AAC.1